MRFLLNPVRTAAKSTAKSARGARKETPEMVGGVTSTIDTSTNISDRNKVWGQQCSPTCGCVVRFETAVDPESRTIIDAKYYAKSVISIKKDGILQPVYTNRTGKPMFKDCDCKTIHDLGRKMSAYLPKKNIDNIRNMTEFSSRRSSPSFRHAVLAEHGHPRKNTHCFDVLEEAFTAMVRGNMPKQRENNMSYRRKLLADVIGHVESPQRGIKPVSMTSASALAALEVIRASGEASYDEKSHQSWVSGESEPPVASDWIRYVDEQYGEMDTA